MTAPERVLQVLEDWTRQFPDLRLAITEYDIDIPDTSSADQKARLEADYTRDFMTAAFSDPQIDLFQTWGIVAFEPKRINSSVWRGNKAIPLWRQEPDDISGLNLKLAPSGEQYLDLVFHRWWTNAEGPSDAKGRFKTRGFLGDYRITVSVNGKTETLKATLPKDGIQLIVKWP